MRPTILAVVRVLTGLFFVASGLAKLFDTHAFVEIAQQYAARPLASFAVILPPLEFMLGAMLVSGQHVYTAAQWVVSLTSLFTLVYTYGLLTKGITDCGCFGNVEFMKLPPWGLYVRNAVLIGAVLWIASSSMHAAGKSHITGAREVALVLLGAAAFLTAGMSYKGPLLKQQPQAASTWHWQPRNARSPILRPVKPFFTIR